MEKFNEYFKKLREDAGLTKEELAQKLNVKVTLVEMLESGKSINLILAKKILTKANELLKAEKDLFQLYLNSFQDELPKNRYEINRILNLDIFLLIILLFFLIYFGWSFKKYIEPPKVNLVEGELLVTDPYYVLEFTVQPPDSIVYINDVKIYPNKEGKVKKELYLDKGANRFKIKVVNKLNRVKELEKVIIYQSLD